MADPSGIASWPGVQQVLQASMTLSLGITPSVCTLEIVPQDPSTISEFGELSFLYGDTQITFKRCKVDKALYQYTQQGFVHQLSILDKRWTWAWGAAVGIYNEHFPGIDTFGSLDVSTIQTPQVLAAYLLSLILQPGEAYDVSQLPNDTRPEVRWDYDVPAQELARLCDSLGCKVALGTDDVIRVVRAGVGADLPDGSILRISQVVDTPEKPDTVAVVGAPVRYQVDFNLEAVGLDTDGTIQKIDDLSYRPKAGWSKILPDTQVGFLDVVGWEQDPLVPANLARAQQLGFINPRELARQTVYRWYRISMTAIDDVNKTPQIPGWKGNPGERITYLWQVLPTEDVQVEGYYDVLGGNKFVSLPAWVFGQFFTHSFPPVAADGTPGNSSPGAFCYFDFELDTTTGIVKFTEPVYYLNADWSLAPARLTLRVAVQLSADDDAHVYRPVVRRTTGAPQAGTPVKYVKREDIVAWVIPTYDPDHKVTALKDNQAEVQGFASYYLDAELLEIQTQTPQDATYAGLLNISPDGKIQQVTWETNQGGATTRASTHTEWNPVVPSYRERYLLSQIRNQPDVVGVLQAQQRKRR